MSESEQQSGFALRRGVLTTAAVVQLRARVGVTGRAGLRGLLADPGIRELTDSSELLAVVGAWLSGPPVAVRAILFDKSVATNWLVAWHQDLTIAVKDRIDVPGFGPWTVKAGVVHVQPPASFLEGMIAVRLHLDDAHEQNGALRVLPGSHRCGKLSDCEIQQYRSECEEVTVTAAAGDALLMRPLLLHASGRSLAPGCRRVLHIEYAGAPLPGGMEWAEGNFSASR